MRRRSEEVGEDVAKNGQPYLESASVIDEAPSLMAIEATEMNSTESEICDMDIEGDSGRRTDSSRHGRIDLVEMLPPHSSHQTAAVAGQERPFDLRDMFDGIESAPERNEHVMLRSENTDLGTLRRMTTSAE